MQFINPDLLGNFNFFKKEFITPIEKKGDEIKKEKLKKLVGPYLKRRTKEEVLDDLPSLQSEVFYSEMLDEQSKQYEQEKSAARNYILNVFKETDPKHKIQVLQTLMKLRQLVNHPKLVDLDSTFESGKFNDIIEQWNVVTKAGHKVLIFSSFVGYLEIFAKHFRDIGASFSLLTGNLSAKKREQEIDRFEKEKSVQTFLISIKAGGVGLNLTAADHVFIVDPWWNPFVEKQAIARAHRIGQDKKVFVQRFITQNSIEEKIARLQEKKSTLADDILGKTSGTIKLDKDQLVEVLG